MTVLWQQRLVGLAREFLPLPPASPASGGLASVAPRVTLALGLPFGVAVWRGAHVIMVPLLGVATPLTRQLPAKEAVEFLLHLVYGVITEAVRRTLDPARDHECRQRCCPELACDEHRSHRLNGAERASEPAPPFRPLPVRFPYDDIGPAVIQRCPSTTIVRASDDLTRRRRRSAPQRTFSSA